MNHDLAAVLDYLDQRFGSSDRQAFEERLAQEPHLRELLEKTRTMQRNLRSIFGQSERLVAPSHSQRRLAKFAKFKHTINALMLVVLLLGGVYLKKQFDIAPQISNEPTYLALANREVSLPQQQMLLVKGIDHEQNHFVRAMQDDQVMWQANNVEALIIADNGDRIELSKTQSHYVLSRKSSDDNPLWQQSLPFNLDTINNIDLYANNDNSEIFININFFDNPNQSINQTSRLLNILPKNMFFYTNTEDHQSSNSSMAYAVRIHSTYLVFDSINGTIKKPASECKCSYFLSNQRIYPSSANPLETSYLGYTIATNNPNILYLVNYDHQVLTYDLRNQQIINSVDLDFDPQIKNSLLQWQQDINMIGRDGIIIREPDNIAEIRFSGNNQVIFVKSSDGSTTTFYAFDRQSGKQLWKNTLLRSFDSFTPNWDGTEVYAVRASIPSELRRYSTLYTVRADDIVFTDYPNQQLEEIIMVYDF